MPVRSPRVVQVIMFRGQSARSVGAPLRPSPPPGWRRWPPRRAGAPSEPSPAGAGCPAGSSRTLCGAPSRLTAMEGSAAAHPIGAARHITNARKNTRGFMRLGGRYPAFLDRQGCYFATGQRRARPAGWKNDVGSNLPTCCPPWRPIAASSLPAESKIFTCCEEGPSRRSHRHPSCPNGVYLWKPVAPWSDT